MDNALRFYVHSNILRARAPPLGQLAVGTDRSHGVCVPSSARVLRALVEFVYTDHCPLALLKRVELQTLSALAQRYAMPALMAHVNRRIAPMIMTIPHGIETSGGDAHAVASAGPRAAPPSLHEDIMALIDHPDLTDVVLQSPGGGFQALTCCSVLAARSEFFRELLSGRWGLPQDDMGRKLLELPAELPEQPLRDLLQYLHGGDVGLKWLPPMALERVQGLMEWGRFLLMPELVDHCQEYFRRRVQVGSIVTVWSIAEHFELEELQEWIVHYCIRNFQELAGSDEFAVVPRGLLRQVLRTGRLEASSGWLLAALERWARLQLQRDSQAFLQLSSEKLADFLRDLLPPCTIFNAANRAFLMQGWEITV